MNKFESKYFNTAKKMSDALIILLEQKEFIYITIKDICKIAKVNRSTFYLHYENTYDLLEEVINSLTSSFNEHLGKKDVTQLIKNNNLNDLYFIKDEFLIPYLEFIKANKNVYKALKNHPDLFKADKTYEKMFNNVFSPIMSCYGLDIKFHKYLMDFYMHGISAIILDWLKDDCQITIADLSELIKGIITKYDKKLN